MAAVQPISESPEWKQARRTAFVQDVLAILTQRPASLMSFQQVSEKLHLVNMHDRGVQDISLDRIVGSVGRPADFTRAFFPREDHLQERWQRIEKLALGGRNMPPVELYQVGQTYFVDDGNHRVSVARQLGRTTIKAHVWEYDSPVPLEPDSDVDELLCQAAHSAFLERTHFDRLCPEVEVRLTEPDGYVDLLAEIEEFQQIVSQIDQEDVPFDQAVTLWCELRYAPLVEIMRQRRVLDGFAGRTEADLYLWLGRHQAELEEQYGHRLLVDETADDLSQRFGEGVQPVRQMKKTVAQARRTVVGWVNTWARAVRQALELWRTGE